MRRKETERLRVGSRERGEVATRDASRGSVLAAVQKGDSVAALRGGHKQTDRRYRTFTSVALACCETTLSPKAAFASGAKEAGRQTRSADRATELSREPALLGPAHATTDDRLAWRERADTGGERVHSAHRSMAASASRGNTGHGAKQQGHHICKCRLFEARAFDGVEIKEKQFSICMGGGWST